MKRLTRGLMIFAATVLLVGCQTVSEEDSVEEDEIAQADDFSDLESLRFTYRLPDDFDMNDVFTDAGETNESLVRTYQELTDDQLYEISSFAGDVFIVNANDLEIELDEAFNDDVISPDDLLEMVHIHQVNDESEVVASNDEGTQIYEYDTFYLTNHASKDEGLYHIEFSPKFTEEHMDQLDEDKEVDE